MLISFEHERNFVTRGLVFDPEDRVSRDEAQILLLFNNTVVLFFCLFSGCLDKSVRSVIKRLLKMTS